MRRNLTVKQKQNGKKHRVDLPEIKFPFTIIFGIDFCWRETFNEFLLLYTSTFSKFFEVMITDNDG